MKIDYNKILNKNMINVFIDVLKDIELNGLQNGHHLYITFKTNNSKVKIPNWLFLNYPQQITIVMQYEYWNFKIKKDSFSISLSFDNIKADLEIPFDCIISFADPHANFGLKIIEEKGKIKKHKEDKTENIKKNKKKDSINSTNNIIDFNNFKKN